MRNHKNCANYGGRATVGGIMIFIGALFLLKSLNIINYNLSAIFTPAFFFMVVGIIILVNSSKKVFGAILTLIGAVWLLPKVVPGININHEFVLPIIVIALGLYIIFKHRNRPEPPKFTEGSDPSQQYKYEHPEKDYSYKYEKKDYNYSYEYQGKKGFDYNVKKDYIDDVAIFGGGQRNVYSDSFKGGNITAIFGGSEINLTNCKLAEGNNIIDVIAIFGGAEIRVPRDWNVIVNATPIFGGFANKIVRDPDMPVDTSRTLVIKGIAMFGGIEINSKRN